VVHHVADCVADISASLLRELALSINWMARFSLFALRNEAAAPYSEQARTEE